MLITGANGFLGRNVARYFKSCGFYIVGIGYGKWKTEKYEEYGIGKWVENEVNLENLKRINDDYEYIVHCAGGSSVRYSILDPIRDFIMTVNSTIAVLEYMKQFQPSKKLIYPSSAAVYGLKRNEEIKESEKMCPISPYGLHKKITEEICEYYANMYNLNIAIIRFFSIYGEGLKKQLLWDACNKMISNKNVIEFNGTGNEIRDWLNIKDAIGLIHKVLKKNKKFNILNGGTGIRTKNREILSMISKHYGSLKKIEFNNYKREGDPRYYLASIERVLKLKWSPSISVEKGVAEYVQWFKNRSK